MSNSYGQYEEYKRKQAELIGYLKDGADIASSLNMNNFRENLEKLVASTENESFKVLIVGTFKNGKSTLINSILGEEVLPAYALPCTAVVNEVKWGEVKKATVHFRNPLPEKLSKGIPEKARIHMQKHNYKDVPPIAISYDEIEDYAVISINNGAEEIEFESPYEKIELFWPLELLRNGVEIIDSPGLNEHATRTAVTMGYINKADAILFVLDATHAAAADEMETIEYSIKEQGFEDPFIITNRFDLIRQKDREGVVVFIKQKLRNLTKGEFHFVSALNGLDGKLEHDEELLNGSGIPQLETALESYLTKNKGRAKLLRPTKELRKVLKEEALEKIIPMNKSALSCSLDDVKAKYEEASPRFEKLDELRTSIEQRLASEIEKCKPEFRNAMSARFVEISKLIPGWVSKSKIVSTKLGVIPKEPQVKAAIKEISDQVMSELTKSQNTWKQQVLIPLVDKHFRFIFGSVENDIKKFQEEIDSINKEVTGADTVKVEESVWERINAITGDALAGENVHVDSASVNSIGNAIAKYFGASYAAGAIMYLTYAFNPVVLAIAIIGSLVVGGVFTKSSAEKIKEKVSAEMVKSISASAEENSNKLPEDIAKAFTETASTATASMEKEISELKTQLDGIVAELEKGQESVKQKEEELTAKEETIKALIEKIDTFQNAI